MINKITPVRLQLSRKKGFRLVSPNELPIKVVSRPSKWGNMYGREDYRFYEENGYPSGWTWQRMAAGDFELALHSGDLAFSVEDVKLYLSGYNLACWCPLPEEGKPDYCHAAVLLHVAYWPSIKRKILGGTDE